MALYRTMQCQFFTFILMFRPLFKEYKSIINKDSAYELLLIHLKNIHQIPSLLLMIIQMCID